jgi:hypothetical protein
LLLLCFFVESSLSNKSLINLSDCMFQNYSWINIVVILGLEYPHDNENCPTGVGWARPKEGKVQTRVILQLLERQAID